jgi:anti-anti-sigma factor
VRRVTALVRIDTERWGGVVLASVRGELDASNVGLVGGRLRGVLENRSEALVLDLTATSYLDSAGIALLFGLTTELQVHQQTLHLVVDPASPLARIVALSGVSAAIPTHDSVRAALAGAATVAPTGKATGL